jgi:ActR/RegA family two-component response regulator
LARLDTFIVDNDGPFCDRLAKAMSARSF